MYMQRHRRPNSFGVSPPLMEAAQDAALDVVISLCIEQAAHEGIELEYQERLPCFATAQLLRNVNAAVAWRQLGLGHEQSTQKTASGWSAEEEPAPARREQGTLDAWAVPSKKRPADINGSLQDDEGSSSRPGTAASDSPKRRRQARRSMGHNEKGKDSAPMVMEMEESVPKLPPEEAAFEAKMKAEYNELMQRMKEEADAKRQAAEEAREKASQRRGRARHTQIVGHRSQRQALVARRKRQHHCCQSVAHTAARPSSQAPASALRFNY